MRLLFVSHSLPPHSRPMENVGGMQRVAVDLHDSLLSHREIEAKALVLRSAWAERGVRTPLFLATALRQIRQMVREREIDAILFSSMVTAPLVLPLRHLLKKNGIVTAAIVNGLDATTPTWPYPLIVKRTFDALDISLPISTATAAACSERGLSTDKCTVVSLGVRLDRFPASLDRAEARGKLLGRITSAGTRGPRLILSSVGRLVARKGVAWFLSEVMPLLPDDVHYVVAGDGPERDRIRGVMTQLGLENRVTLLGAVSEADLQILYRGSDLFMMPNVPVANDMEGFGLVMLEAGLCGLPTIASRLEGISDVITEGENGFLVTSGDADGFRRAVMDFYQNPHLLITASERARLHTVARFGWSGVIDKYVSVIQQHWTARTSDTLSSSSG
jgi:phosphatidyl-myo-inositol dimannoside synthase